MSSKKTPLRRHLQVSLKKARREPRRRAKKMPSEGSFKRSSRRCRQKTPSSVLQKDIMSISRRRRPEDTLKNLSRRLVESQEDAAKKMPSEDNFRAASVFQEDIVMSISRRRCPEDTSECPSRRSYHEEKIGVWKWTCPEDNFKCLSRRRCHEEKVEDWKWKLEVIMNITFNARQKCYYSYWQMQSQSPSTLQQHNGQT